MNQRPWISSYGAIPAEIDSHRYACVPQLLDEAVQRYGDRTAFHSFGKSISFNDVDRLSSHLAAYLQNVAHVKKGDRVAVMLPNIPAFPVAFMAITRIGAIQVNVNPLYTSRELEHQINDSGADVIVIIDSAIPRLAEVIENTCIHVVLDVCLKDCTGVHLSEPERVGILSGAVALAEAIKQGSGMSIAPVPLDGEDLMILQYTGGTTGPSKGAALSHRNLIANIEQFRAFMHGAMRPGQEVVATVIPMYHIFALMVNFLSYFSVGAENWLVTDARDLDCVVDTLKEARPTVLTGVNTLYTALMNHPGFAEVDWSSLRMTVGGGAAVLRSTSDRWKAATGCFILEGYGLSETSPVITVNPFSTLEFSGATGMPVPSTEVKLLDAQDLEVSLGEAGEVCVKGPQVMRGYWQKPKENALAFTPDGYFRTGDMGVFDERGFLRIVDRKKDMVLVSGFNVYPNEIEAVASACPGVVECACVGVPDDRTGEALMLYAVRQTESQLSMHDLVTHCRKQLAPYKVPKRVVFVEVLPKSTVGKILRRELRQSA
ncbi:AMP-binding protein [Variovorax sp. YR566]|uniref:AMP-binding protein n=1 Tax=Variovorax sp. YR566 TaxID=3450237 RepID=UPI003F7DB5BD